MTSYVNMSSPYGPHPYFDDTGVYFRLNCASPLKFTIKFGIRIRIRVTVTLGLHDPNANPNPNPNLKANLMVIILVRCAVQAKINTCIVNGEDMLTNDVNIGLVLKDPIQSDPKNFSCKLETNG